MKDEGSSMVHHIYPREDQQPPCDLGAGDRFLQQQRGQQGGERELHEQSHRGDCRRKLTECVDQGIIRAELRDESQPGERGQVERE